MSFSRGTAYIFCSNALTGVLSLVVNVIFARTLGVVAKGDLALLMVAPAIIGLALDSGLSIANVYFLKTKRADEEALFGNGTAWAFAAGVLSIGATLIYVWWNGPIPKLRVGSLALVVAAVTVPLQLFVGLQRNLLLVSKGALAFGTNTAMQPALLLITCATFFLLLGPSATNGVVSQCVAMCLVSLLLTYQLRIRTCRFDRAVLAEGLKFGFVGHLGTIVQYLNYRLDVIILGALAGAASVGVYSVSYTCAEILWRLPRAMGTMLFPAVAGATRDQADYVTVNAFKFINTIMALATLCAAGVGYLLIPLLFGKSFTGAIVPYLLLLPGVYLFGWSTVLVEDLKGRGFPHYKLLTAGIALFITVIGDFALIPEHGEAGAAVASSLAYGVAGAASVWVFARETGIPISSLFAVRMRDLDAWKQVLLAHEPDRTGG